MKTLITVFVLLSLVSCTTSSDIDEVKFQFIPAFMPYTEFTIDLKAETLTEYQMEESYNLIDEEIDLKNLKSQPRDTIVLYQKVYDIPHYHFRNFLMKINDLTWLDLYSVLGPCPTEIVFIVYNSASLVYGGDS